MEEELKKLLELTEVALINNSKLINQLEGVAKQIKVMSEVSHPLIPKRGLIPVSDFQQITGRSYNYVRKHYGDCIVRKDGYKIDMAKFHGLDRELPLAGGK